MLAKNRIRQILTLTLRANHNGNQSQLGCILPNSIKPELGVHSEGSKQCIVPGYAKNKLKDCDNVNTQALTLATSQSLLGYTWPGATRQLENKVKRLVASVRGKTITEDHLDDSIRNLRIPARSYPPKEEPTPWSPEVAILTGRRRAFRTPANRRGTAKFWRKQTKSGPGASLSRQGLIKKLKRLSTNQ
jgi:DNA-binding NtrC family response regulator